MSRDILHEHLAPPEIVFSCAFLSQLQFNADCLPQEHLAFDAQMQVSLLRPQQVVGLTILFRWWGFGDVWKSVGASVREEFGAVNER
jgi:hypothetical protein